MRLLRFQRGNYTNIHRRIVISALQRKDAARACGGLFDPCNGRQQIEAAVCLQFGGMFAHCFQFDLDCIACRGKGDHVAAVAGWEHQRTPIECGLDVGEAAFYAAIQTDQVDREDALFRQTSSACLVERQGIQLARMRALVEAIDQNQVEFLSVPSTYCAPSPSTRWMRLPSSGSLKYCFAAATTRGSISMTVRCASGRLR